MDNQPPRIPQQPSEPTPPQSWQAQPAPIVPPLPVTPPQEVEPTTATPERPDIFIPPFYQPPAPKKSHKKRWLIIIAAIFVVLIGGAAAAYFLWYQNPEKVVTDGIVHAMQAKSVQYTGSLTTGSDTSKVKIELTGASVTNAQDVSAKITFPIGGKDFVVEGEGLFDGKNDLYLKLKNLDDMTTPLRNEINSSARATFDRIIAKINNQWVKISVGDLAGLSEAASKTQSCAGDAIKKLSSDQAAMNELTDAYKKNKFVTVDQNLGTKDGSVGYTLSGDAAKTKAFVTNLKDTKLYKSLQACDSSFSLDENDFAPTKDQSGTTHAEVWVSQFTHEITKVVFNAANDDASEKVDTVFEPKFNTDVTVATPTDATTLEQLQSDIETLLKELAQPATKTPVQPKA